MNDFSYTAIGGSRPFSEDERPSPSLIYHKWHAFDSFSGGNAFETKEARRVFLNEVARAVSGANENYEIWHGRYMNALHQLHARNLDMPFPTLWRLLTGWSANPALETGVCLHHLYGFPYVPGSTVKGLVHHFAEMELMEDDSWMPPRKKENGIEKKKIAALEEKISGAKLIRELFGSMCLESLKPEDPDYSAPANWFGGWLKIARSSDRKDLKSVEEDLILLSSNQHTGGMLCFFDAVPEPESMKVGKILQLDILNPHYPKYYEDETGKTPPSDDQSPKPVYFLAVRPNAKFTFPFKLQAWPRTEGRDSDEKERAAVLRTYTQDKIIEKVDGWIRKAISTLGVGAKTASGYGYFDVERK